MNILKFYLKYLLNILSPYYKFIQTILIYSLKLLQMTLLYIYNMFILITCNKKLNFNIFHINFFKNNNILLHNDNDDEIGMIGKIMIITRNN